MTSRLGMGKWLTFFYSVHSIYQHAALLVSGHAAVHVGRPSPLVRTPEVVPRTISLETKIQYKTGLHCIKSELYLAK